MVPAINEGLQKWKDNVPTFIWDKPLPDPEQLNAAIPKNEWEKGLDGNLREPWEHIVAVILVDPSTGTVYRFTSATKGAHAAYDQLKERVITMRMLRGHKVLPVVRLSERPWKTQFGMKKRPHFEIAGWKVPGRDDSGAAIPAKPTPQISGPTTPMTTTEAAPPTTAPAASVVAGPDASPSYQAKPKAPVNLSGETLTAMSDVKPATMGEIVGDDVPW